MSLYNRITGFTNCLDQRPSRDDFTGINVESIQSQNLMGWWPVWEPMSNAAKAPQACDYGPYGLHFRPGVNCLHVPDPQMGVVWYGQPNPAGMTGLFSGQAQMRPYNNGVTGVDPVDFGSLPSTGAVTTGTSYMSTAWVKTGISAQTLTAASQPPDMYIYSFDRNDGADYPGHALTGIMQIPNGGSSATETRIAASIYDNNVGNDPFGAQSLQIINDNQWHLICAIYIPGIPAGSSGGLQWILVDGNIGFQGGNDVQGAGAQPFGSSKSQDILGSPQDATHAAANAVYQIFGSDDDGVSSPWQGYLSDHRLYAFPTPPSTATTSIDMLQVWMQLAAHMYAPETRWELYRKPARQISIFSLAAISGSGSIVLAGLTPSATPTFTAPSTGGITLGSLTPSSAGTFTDSGTGSVTLGSLAISSSPTFTSPATGSITLVGLTSSGTGTFTDSVSGTITLGALGVSSAGTFSTSSSGAVTLGPLSISASPGFTDSGSGSLTLGSLTVSSSPGFTDSASGAITLGSLSVSSAESFTASSSGAVTLGALTISDGTSLTNNASGTITLAALTVSSAGTFTDSGSGAITLGTIVVAGSGTATGGTISGSGAITLGALGISAATAFTASSSGSVSLGPLTISASPTFTSPATGSLTLGSLSISDTTSFTTTSSDAITLGALSPSSVATFKASSSGSVTLGSLATSVSPTFTSASSGTVTLGSITQSASVSFGASASGSVTLGSLGVSATETFTAIAAGGITLGGLVSVGVGTGGGVTGTPIGFTDPFASSIIPISTPTPAHFESDPTFARVIAISIAEPAKFQTDPSFARVIL